MKATAVIAALSLSERRREPWGLILVAGLAAVGLSGLVVGEMSVASASRGTLEASLFASWLVGNAVAAELGALSLGAPLRDGTAAGTLSGPVGRGEWALGRLIGALVANLAVQGLLGAFVVAAVSLRGLDPSVWPRLVGAVEESVVVLGISALLSTLWSRGPAFLTIVGLVICGHLLPQALEGAALAAGPLYGVTVGVSLVVPQLDRFDFGDVVPEAQFAAGPHAVALAHALGWWTLCGALAVVVVNRKDDL
jgi:hypothetical protein